VAQYLLLLRDDGAAFAKMSPEEMQKTTEKYMEWRNRPFVVGGQRLDMAGRMMVKKDGKIGVTDGPFSESREVLGGYFAIEAKDFDEAVALSMDNPHATLGIGTIEIREVMPRPDGN
jgi:hypothetical protein